MQKNKSVKVKASDGRALAVGLISAIGAMVVMLIISSICIVNECFDLETFGIISLFIQYISVFIGAFAAGALAENSREGVVLVVGSILYLLQLCFALLLFDGIKHSFWVNLLITAIAVVSAALILSRGKINAKSRSIRKRR